MKMLIEACLNSDFHSFEQLLTQQSSLINFLNNPINENKDTLLHLSIIRQQFAITELLLKQGANTEVPNDCQQTALHLACLHGHLNQVELLLINNANTEATDENGFFPLYLASSKGYYEIVKYLLDAKANVNAKMTTGFLASGGTALHVAASKGHTDIVNLLLEHGASPKDKNALQKTPFRLAGENNHSETLALLFEKGADIQEFSFFSKSTLCSDIKKKYEKIYYERSPANALLKYYGHFPTLKQLTMLMVHKTSLNYKNIPEDLSKEMTSFPTIFQNVNINLIKAPNKFLSYAQFEKVKSLGEQLQKLITNPSRKNEDVIAKEAKERIETLLLKEIPVEKKMADIKDIVTEANKKIVSLRKL